MKMKEMFVNGIASGVTVEIASSVLARMRGLIGRDALDTRSAMALPMMTMSVHTCFMKFPIDVVFINFKGQIVKIVPEVKPWRFLMPVLSSWTVLELRAGMADALKFNVGDFVSFSDVTVEKA